MPQSLSQRGDGWFVVLPDCAAANAVADVFRGSATQEVRHNSGRPWLLGRWSADELLLGRSGATRLAVIGRCPETSGRLDDLAAGLTDIADLDRVGARLAGSFHLLASVAGDVCARGTASGLRRLFSARLHRVTVASDRSDVLAGMLAGPEKSAAMDEELLALRLLGDFIPHPFSEQSVWRGVRVVPAGSCLRLSRDGTDRIAPWWSPPEPTLSLAEGAGPVREALTAAVDARTAEGGVISADLSGGLDSTPLCFLAARGPSRLLTVTQGSVDPTQDDVTWAQRATTHLPEATSLVFSPDELPPAHHELHRQGHGLDEPETIGRLRSQYVEIARLLAARGSRVHLSGQGGDEVLQASPVYPHDLVWSHPRTALRHLRGQRAKKRWSWWTTVRALAERQPYGRWLSATSRDLSPALRYDRRPRFGWGLAPELPPWVSAQAVDTVRSRLAGARESEPLAGSRAQHQGILSVRNGARMMRHLARQMAAAGLPMEFPFYDDHVLNACLAVQLPERASTFTFKPLIVQAMHGIVPNELLARRTKGDFAADARVGFERQRAVLTEWLEDPLLARLGLVDADRFRAACLGLYPPGLSPSHLEISLALEAWLRARETGHRVDEQPDGNDPPAAFPGTAAVAVSGRAKKGTIG
jgi:asparagine synthase (glutamine-hydrolysing)